MNTTIRNTALASILFAAASGAAFAADTADLTVKGVIKPAACTPLISGGGVIDFGTIAASSLSSSAETVLPQKNATLTLTCDAATKMALGYTDNRAGTSASADPATFGLGAVGGKNIGSYSIAVGNDFVVTADGNSVSTITYSSLNPNVQWGLPNWEAVRPKVTYVSWATVGTRLPAAFKTVVQPITVNVRIDKTGNLPSLTQDVPLDGSATISVFYM